MNFLEKKLRELEEGYHEEAIAKRMEDFTAQEREDALIFVGGVIAIDRLKTAISAECIRGLCEFQESGRYKALGFKCFADFLNHYKFALMTKTEFYERKKVLDAHGDPTYDFLTVQLAFPLSRQKYLGQGNIRTDGENVIITPEDDDTDEIIIPSSNHTLIVETLYRITDAKMRLRDENRRLTATVEKQKQTIANVHEDLDRSRSANFAEISSNPHILARIELGIAFRRLTESADNLSSLDKDQFRDSVLEDVAGWLASLRASYRIDRAKKPVDDAPLTGNSVGEAYEAYIENADLDAVEDNDGELAAKL